MIETDVLVIGGGPVGTMLAGELGWRGVRTTVFEERTTPTVHPKATLLGARSMEYFRRWGLTERIYDQALPRDNRYFITFSTRLAGRELHPLRGVGGEVDICGIPDPITLRFLPQP